MKRTTIIEVKQPIGVFYIGCLPARQVLKIAEANIRRYDTQAGIQRDESKSRIKEISRYCSDPDTAFPTPIILAVSSQEFDLNGNVISFDEVKARAEIIDGQHRVKGIQLSGMADLFDLPVIFMFDLTAEEKAYVFSIINSKQTKVPASLIYDLFDLSEKRSPQKTCHEIARLMNIDETSAFYKRLKMLGRKEEELASLSQGSFIRYLLPLISKDPDQDMRDIKSGKKLIDDSSKPFRNYFIIENDQIIYKILHNYFTAVKSTFPDQWSNPREYILSKTTGYGALLYAFPRFFEVGKEKKTLSVAFFESGFLKFKNSLSKDSKKLTSDFYGSGEQEQKTLGEYMVRSAFS